MKCTSAYFLKTFTPILKKVDINHLQIQNVYCIFVAENIKAL